MKDVTFLEFCAFVLILGMGVIVARLESKVRCLEWKAERLDRTIEIMTKPMAISEWVASSTNRVTITRDPIDNMPMYGVDMNGRLTQ